MLLVKVFVVGQHLRLAVGCNRYMKPSRMRTVAGDNTAEGVDLIVGNNALCRCDGNDGKIRIDGRMWSVVP